MTAPKKVWQLQEAKARFSELVRLAQSEGPQTVTVHGRPAVIITAVTANQGMAEDAPPFGHERPADKPKPTMSMFLAAMRACPYKDDLPLGEPGEPMEIRDRVEF